MAIVPPRSKVLFLPVVRGGYTFSLTSSLLPLVRQAATRTEIDGILPTEGIGHDGCVRTDGHFAAYWEQWRGELHDIAGLVVFSGDFMQERRVMDAVRLLAPDVPVFLIVNNDDPTRMEEKDVGDSLCGSLSVHHNVRMLGREIVRSCRMNMHDEDALANVLSTYGAVIRGIEALRNMRVALLGVNPDSFATTFVNQPLLFKLGFSLHTYELLDMWGDIVLGGELPQGVSSYEGTFGRVRLAGAVPKDDPRVASMREQIEPLLPGRGEGLGDGMDRLTRCMVWLERTFEAGRIDTGALHCWGEFERFFGIRSCGFSMLANAVLGKPVVCEVDVCHAIMAKLGAVLTGEPAVILDINNNGWDPRVFNVFHCSQTPPNWLVDGGSCLTALGEVCGTVTPGPFTAVSAATSADACTATVFTGCFIPGDGGSRGCTGWAFVPNFPEVLKQVERTGIHHFVAMKGLQASVLTDVLRFRGIDATDLSVAVPSVEEAMAELTRCRS